MFVVYGRKWTYRTLALMNLAMIAKSNEKSTISSRIN